MAENYEDVKGLLDLITQRKKDAFGQGLKGLAYGMQNKVMPDETQDTTGRDLLKAIMMEKIKAQSKAPVQTSTEKLADFEERQKIIAKYKTPKTPSKKQTFTDDLISYRDSVRSGQTTPEDVINELTDKYPADMTSMKQADIRMQLRKLQPKAIPSAPGPGIMERVGSFFKGSGNIERDRAVQELKSSGYPTTEANIAEVMRQLKGQ